MRRTKKVEEDKELEVLKRQMDEEEAVREEVRKAGEIIQLEKEKEEEAMKKLEYRIKELELSKSSLDWKVERNKNEKIKRKILCVKTTYNFM